MWQKPQLNAIKKQKKFDSDNKKQHTLKLQVIVNQVTKKIICLAHTKGKDHDFRIFKESKVIFNQELECLADKRYQGIQKMHAMSRIPKKKPKKADLSAEDKSQNSHLAKKRIVVEHIHRRLKVFRILSSRYRNRHLRFGLRFTPHIPQMFKQI